MCSCDGPRPVIYDSIVRKAIKTHCCSECGEKIASDHYYESVSGLWDGSWGHYKTCSRCVQLRDLLTVESNCCFSHGGLYEEANDYDDLVRTLTVADREGAYRLYRANACSLVHANLNPKLYDRHPTLDSAKLNL